MVFVEGLSRPEAPVLLSDNSWLVVEMGPDRGCVTPISADGQTRRTLAQTGRPNGLAIDREGAIWVAESINPPALLRMDLDGNFETVLTEDSDGDPFLFPNDLAFGPDGALYMTDTGILYEDWASRRADYQNVYPDGRVYRIDLETQIAVKLDRGIRFTNGIAFGPDHTLYANATITGDIYSYAWQDGQVQPERRVFANAVDPNGPDGYKGTDGMAFGRNGLLYCTVFGQGDVSVFSPEGSVVKRLPLDGKSPTNVAFGPPGEKRIYVTEQGIGRIEVLEVDTEGLPLHP